MASAPPLKFPGDFPGRTGDRFRAAELICLANEPIRRGDDALIIPGDNLEQAKTTIDAISSSVESLRNSYAIRAAGSGLPGKFTDAIYKARSNYMNELKSLHEIWVREGKQVTDEVASRFVIARDVAKQTVRAETPLPSMLFKVLDRNRAKITLPDGSRIGGWTPTEKIFWGRTEEAIQSSFKSNAQINTKLVTVGGPVAALLRTGGYMVVATDLTQAGVRMYNATTKDEQQAALEDFGKSAGSAVGMAAGGMLCGAMGLTTGGLGFAGCAVVTTLSSYAGEQAGGWIFGGSIAADVASRLR
ncbi:hypothetical protein [Sphingomonas sp. BK345]|uniref:hypothetical protein n=1 Tax=Sphingomonas sp. BK345 TaxID=2586980 RepID=UPI00161485F8|nr:hypothetical protein [Sphingomonas sp. BK345]MBB3473523.1 hypothetical protein [Sphingomonas sp. BK345]